MGIFKRTKDIITANVNSMLDSAENPEAMINQIIRELEVAISDQKCNCADKIADKKRFERTIKDLNKDLKGWNDRAELAVNNAKDDLAKEALRERSIVAGKLTRIESEYQSSDSDIDVCKEQVLKLEEKLSEMVNKKRELLQRINRVKETNYTNSVINKASGVDVLEKFSRFESKIERMEAEAEIFGSHLESTFEGLEQEKRVEDELNELKSKLKNAKNNDSSKK